MAINFEDLKKASRLLVEVSLKPIQGERFQPTNFPDQQAALYRAPKYNPNGEVEKDANGNPVYEDVLLVESPQSMANRMERVCWDDGAGDDGRVGDYNEDCKGIPYVLAVDANQKKLTASPLEAHRLASPYIWNTQPYGNLSKPLPDYLKEKFELSDNRLVPWKKVAAALLEVDPGCLLHGVWFSNEAFSGGKVRLTRSLTGFIEARSPQPANYGFQKRDPVSDRTEPEAGQTAKEGFGSVIGPMQDFTSPDIRAYFQLDVGRLRSYGLPDEKFEALLAWAIYKIRKVLTDGRDTIGDLRTRCKFMTVGEPKAVLLESNGKSKPWDLPKLDDEITKRISKLKGNIITVKWIKGIPKIEGKAELGDVKPEEFNLKGFEGKVTIRDEPKSKNERTEVKRLVIFGEFTEEDEKRLRQAHAEKKDALSVIDEAVKKYRANYEAKVTGTKEGGKGEDEEQEPEPAEAPE